MYVIVVYDTAVERNARILRTCRKYLHHVQRSVFEGNLSEAQIHRFRAEVQQVINVDYDHVLVYTLPPGADPRRQVWGVPEPRPSDIL